MRSNACLLRQFCSLSKLSVVTTKYSYLVKAWQCLTGSSASVDHGFANLPDVKHGRGLDIIPIFLSKRINAVKICRRLGGENFVKLYAYFKQIPLAANRYWGRGCKTPQHIHLNPSFSFAIHRYFLHKILLTW